MLASPIRLVSFLKVVKVPYYPQHPQCPAQGQAHRELFVTLNERTKEGKVERGREGKGLSVGGHGERQIIDLELQGPIKIIHYKPSVYRFENYTMHHLFIHPSIHSFMCLIDIGCLLSNQATRNAK